MGNGDALGERLLLDGFFLRYRLLYVAASVYGIILHTKIYMQAVCVTKAVVNGVCVLIAEPYFSVGFIASTSPPNAFLRFAFFSSSSAVNKCLGICGVSMRVVDTMLDK